MKVKERQKEAIREWLLLGLPIDPLDAFKLFGTFKISTRIGELERDGKIPTVKRGWKEVKTRYCDKVKVRTYHIESPKSL